MDNPDGIIGNPKNYYRSVTCKLVNGWIPQNPVQYSINPQSIDTVKPELLKYFKVTWPQVRKAVRRCHNEPDSKKTCWRSGERSEVPANTDNGNAQFRKWPLENMEQAFAVPK